MRRVEGWLLAAIGAVLTSAVVSVPYVRDDKPGRTTREPAPTSSPSSTLPPLVVSGARITTYAQGSKQLTISVTVMGGRDPVLRVGSQLLVLRQTGAEVSGTVPVTCGGAVPELVLEVTDAAGDVQTRSLGTPRAQWAAACATPQTGPVPHPTSSSRGS